MEYEDFKINGVISEEELEQFNIEYPCKEISKTIHVKLKKGLSYVKEVFLDVNVTNKKNIFIHKEKMVFFQGLINGTLIYSGNDDFKKDTIIEFKKPFEGTLPINTDNEIKAFIEDTLVSDIDEKNIYISLIILICSINEEDKLNHIENNTDLNINVEYDMGNDEEYNLNYDIEGESEKQYDIPHVYKEYYEVSWK